MCSPESAGERVAYFVGPVPQDKLPKEAGAGGSLVGSLQLGLLQGSKEYAPASLPLFYRYSLMYTYAPHLQALLHYCYSPILLLYVLHWPYKLQSRLIGSMPMLLVCFHSRQLSR